MKVHNYLIVFLVFGLFSCKKGDVGADNGCISLIRRHYISGADSLTAVNLLKQNNIPYSNLAYDRIILNDTVKDFNNNFVSVYQHVFAVQYANSLPIFSSEVGYHFGNGVFQSTSGQRYANVNLSTSHKQSLYQVRKSFLAANGTFRNLKDSCLVAEFGYFNVNSGTNNPTPVFIKAWFVTPYDSLYPQALIRDDNDKLIYYFDGIEF